MRSLEEYMKLPYKLEIIPDTEKSGFVASYPELPGCTSCGETISEVEANIEKAKKEWLVAAIESGVKINEPESLDSYSRQILDEVWSEVEEKWKEICKFNPDADIFKVEIAYYKNRLTPENIYVHLRLKEPYGRAVIFKHYYKDFIQIDPKNPKFYDAWGFWE